MAKTLSEVVSEYQEFRRLGGHLLRTHQDRLHTISCEAVMITTPWHHTFTTQSDAAPGDYRKNNSQKKKIKKKRSKTYQQQLIPTDPSSVQFFLDNTGNVFRCVTKKLGCVVRQIQHEINYIINKSFWSLWCSDCLLSSLLLGIRTSLEKHAAGSFIFNFSLFFLTVGVKFTGVSSIEQKFPERTMMKCSFPHCTNCEQIIYVDTISNRNHVVTDLLPPAYAER